MTMQQEEPRVSIDLGDGVYIDIDIQPMMSGPVVPKPRPKLVAELILDVGDPVSGDASPVKVGLKVAIAHRGV
jgi:hypothetical protein